MPKGTFENWKNNNKYEYKSTIILILTYTFNKLDNFNFSENQVKNMRDNELADILKTEAYNIINLKNGKGEYKIKIYNYLQSFTKEELQEKVMAIYILKPKCP